MRQHPRKQPGEHADQHPGAESDEGDFGAARKGEQRRCHIKVAPLYRGAGDQQGLALVVTDGEHLRDQRSNRAAGHDDRALGAERPTCADGYRRGQRF